MITLNSEQEIALDIMNSGRNVYLTGDAGTGKSTLLQEFIRQHNNIVVCAPTARAALNVGGMTMHRIAKIGTIPHGPDELTWINRSDHPLKTANIIVIDEISMVRIDVFQYFINTIRQFKGRKQVIVVGDFYQLPPVVSKGDAPALLHLWGKNLVFAFDAPAWKELNFTYIRLTQNMRQENDKDLCGALDKIKIGDQKGITHFNERCNGEISEKFQKTAVFLCGQNKDAQMYNNTKLAALKGPEKAIDAVVTDIFDPDDYPTESTLHLKDSARVIAIANDRDERFVNGSLGTVIIDDNGTRIKFDNDNVLEILDKNDKLNPTAFHSWKNIEYKTEVVNKKNIIVPSVIGEFCQIPIKIAYAMTIHKSQGQTYDRVILDPACFAEGQLYVALSRCRSTEGLRLSKQIKPKWLITSKRVLDFYNEIKSKVLDIHTPSVPDTKKIDKNNVKKVDKNNVNQPKSTRGGYRPGAGRKIGSKNKSCTHASIRSLSLGASQWKALDEYAHKYNSTATKVLSEFISNNIKYIIGENHDSF